MLKDDGTITLGYLGYMRRDKGYFFLMKALQALPKKIRARTYVDWMRYLALTLKDPDLKRVSLPKRFTRDGWVVDMKAVHEAPHCSSSLSLRARSTKNSK